MVFPAGCETGWMRAALGVFRAGQDRRSNLARMTGLCERAAGHGADLVVFCEAAVTGFAGYGDSRHDLLLGEPVPGPATTALGAAARRLGLWIGFGLLERASGGLYDSAVLLDRQGQLRQVYRRIDPHWHRPDADPGIYRQGTQPVAVPADFGAISMLICGDLFNDAVLGQVGSLGLDVVIIPMARGFDADVADAAQWQDQEQALYADQIRRIGAAGLLVNQLGGPPGTVACFGGALAVAADGTILAAWALHAEGLLLVDVPPAGARRRSRTDPART
jgi:predicted amidohydrolase